MSSTENTFQIQAEEYLAGTTDTTLGSGIVNSSLRNTSSDIFVVGKNASTGGKGVDLYTTVEPAIDVAGIDLHSLQTVTPNVWDVRIESVGGEQGVNGRGSLGIYCQSLDLNGNAANNDAADFRMRGYHVFPTRVLNVGTNQGRQYAMQEVIWSGSGTNAPVNPVITIQLRDPVSLNPWFGVYDVYMTSAYTGSSSVFDSANWMIAKNAEPPTNIIEAQPARAGSNLTVLYAELDWNATGYPQLKLFNKQAGGQFRYYVRGMIFPDNNAF